MAPTPPSAESHQELLDSLDIALKDRPFRSGTWKPSQRRNKNIKQIVGEQARREASVLATQNNSGSTTPALQSTGSATPAVTNGSTPAPAAHHPNLEKAAQSLSTLVLERNLQSRLAAAGAGVESHGGSAAGGANAGPVATYTNIESAPSLNPARSKPYCDITGLPGPYTDPKTRLRYHNREVFATIRTLPQGVPEQYLAARGAHVILK